jgi:hypothetical protein
MLGEDYRHLVYLTAECAWERVLPKRRMFTDVMPSIVTSPVQAQPSTDPPVLTSPAPMRIGWPRRVIHETGFDEIVGTRFASSCGT